VSIVDGTLIPTGDHTLAARSKNYRYSTNLQVAIDADTRLAVALGDPQPGNRNDTLVYRSSGIDQKLDGRPVIADGAYRGNPEVVIPYRKPADGTALPQWKQDLNTVHRSVPRPSGAHPGPDEGLENPARLPTRRPHIDRHSFRHRPPVQHRHDRRTHNP